MRVGVHQPNFAPWCGYFAKMFQSDAFVFFDDTQLPQGRSYVSRVKIAKGRDADQWLTIPLERRGLQEIREVHFAGEDWARSHTRTLQHVYAKARNVEELLALTEPSLTAPGSSLSEFNIQLIERLARYLGWRGVFYRASSFPANLRADARIAQLVHAIGGDVYVSGAGGQKYQSAEAYAERNVRLEVRDYAPRVYERSGWPFIGGLSVLDAIAHLGTGARSVLEYA